MQKKRDNLFFGLRSCVHEMQTLAENTIEIVVSTCFYTKSQKMAQACCAR